MSPVLPSRFNPPDSHLLRFTTLFIRISPFAHYSFSSRFLTSTLPSSFISANRECLLLQRSSEYGVCVCVCVSIDVSDSRYFPAECRGVSEKKKKRKKEKRKRKGDAWYFPLSQTKLVCTDALLFRQTRIQNTICVSRVPVKITGENEPWIFCFCFQREENLCWLAVYSERIH